MVPSSPDINKLLKKEANLEMMEEHSCFQCNMQEFLEWDIILPGSNLFLDHNLWVKNLLLCWILWQIASAQTMIKIMPWLCLMKGITVMANKAIENCGNHQKTKLTYKLVPVLQA